LLGKPIDSQELVSTIVLVNRSTAVWLNWSRLTGQPDFAAMLLNCDQYPVMGTGHEIQFDDRNNSGGLHLK
jgi:hypothetical protein